MPDFERLEWIWRQHSGKIAGALIGFAFGLFVYWVGFLWTLFILATTLAGYWIGGRLDLDGRDFPEWVEHILTPRRRGP